MKKPQSLRFYLVTLEIITIFLGILFIFGSFNFIQLKISQDFSQRRKAELSAIEMLFYSKLQQAVTTLESLAASDTLLGAQFISEFSDMYIISDNTITHILKKSPQSALFTGFQFSQNLTSFFSYHFFTTVRKSKVFYAPEDEKPSIYLSIPIHQDLLVGRLKIDSINNDIARLVQFDGSIVVITNSDGIPFSSIGGNLPSLILNQPNGSALTINQKQFVLNRISSVWLSTDIVLLTPTNQLQYFFSQIQILTLFTLTAIIGLLFLRFFLLHWLLIKPIEQFIKALNQWESSHNLPEVPVSIQGVTEIQLLAKTFYNKAQEITKMNEKLEKQVHDMGEQLATALDKVLVSEKLAVLGNLTAGLAHELNTPLGAIISTAETIKNAISRIKQDLCNLLTKNDPEENNFFIQLLDASGKTKASLRERMTFINTIELKPISNAEEIADDLIDMEISLKDQKLTQKILTLKQAPNIIKTAYYFNILEKDNAIIQNAAERASLTLKALKQWTYEEKGYAVPVCIKNEMETILTMYYNHTKYTIQIIRNFLDEGWVLANPERLNAVWVNLINNALQAMEQGGTLTIQIKKLHHESDIIQVQVTDTGIGIPEENKPKIFTPFFTTKPRGTGTGIGLDLSKRIIEGFSGTISFTSEPGHTTFTVTLPAYITE
ncbi:sensor histidine kinase [Gracilinema caldarium]|uniref:histidine kinase n=1 Tax=Gracilinema caldarium (strain ATCC 51460 / DSM 7334 / H1) TaxID=744872 RepID=F8F2F0_GRAC1|nr:sensor histidine kinase [Gracilinema caldarium]AEJ20932.1 integral membrane sensor signal transduction histidine kinase [Gracilinema caldarium DSM 7334]